jgi:hypothetical protein
MVGWVDHCERVAGVYQLPNIASRVSRNTVATSGIARRVVPERLLAARP